LQKDARKFNLRCCRETQIVNPDFVPIDLKIVGEAFGTMNIIGGFIETIA
jgi:hypothetical protein